MFEFLRKRRAKGPDEANHEAPVESDLLADAESDEFAESVAAALSRRPQSSQSKKVYEGDAVLDDPVEEIVWNESADVFTPAICSLTALDAPDGSTRVDARSGVKSDAESYYCSVRIRNDAYLKMHSHLRGDLTNELAGLLVGRVFHDPSIPAYLITVEQALPAADGLSTPTSFSYSSESWQALGPTLERLDASRTIVGSYHSHPGLGVFLSSTDLETQTDIFSQPWQIAVVIDPVRDETGVFVGPHGAPCQNWKLTSLPLTASSETANPDADIENHARTMRNVQ